MTDLKGCIRFWELKLFHDKYLMEPSTITLIEITIKFLKELQKYEQIQNQENVRE